METLHFCGLPQANSRRRISNLLILTVAMVSTSFTTGPHGVVASGLLDAGSIKKTGLAAHPYFHHQQTFFFEKKIYLGFWGLCTQIISNQSNLTLDVFENQTDVYEDCQKFLRKYDQSQKIRLFNSSSFDANFSNYDLAFIDPTYRRKR